ncbi:hypothetical protein [Vibrio parahaemolyticus]|uniref:hypothetical protein n=1 Tax=Vibrio parahaemolyticus TaxID=670 RepID=UPI000C99CBF4|nr:hypothetical protein [Vibrio parahaemolyticus]PMS91895.1 hypothetical protein C1T06_22625 [Vibrio parahaemolyticus]
MAKGRKAKYIYKGVKGLPAISKMTGIPYSTLHRRVLYMGMTTQEAVKLGINPNSTKPTPRKLPNNELKDAWKLALGVRMTISEPKQQ